MDEQQITTILWRRKVIVLLAVVAGIAAAVAATLLQDKIYEARSIIQVGATEQGSAVASPEANQALARSYAEVLTSGSFLERIRPRLEDGERSVRSLQDDIEASAITDTAVVRLDARGPTAARAKRLADTVVDGFLLSLQVDATQQVRRQQREIDLLVARLTDRIERLVDSGGSPSTVAQLRASRRALLEQGARLATEGVAEAGSARRVGPASASADPVSPRPLLNLTAGILLGFLAGAGLAWLIERRAPGLHTAEEAAALIDVPVLASIPLRRRYVDGDPVLGEAYDILRANLTFQSRDRGLRVITVVAQNPRVGKTSTVEGLAYAAARSGTRVVVVDADLRLGSLSERLGHQESPGLTDVLGHALDPSRALVELAPGLALLPAHAPAPNPPSLLYSPRARELFGELRERYDLVLVDTPPVGQLADGLILSSLADGALMVARSGVTTRADLVSGVEKVRQTRTPIVGLVAFTSVDVDDEYYPASVSSQPHAQAPAMSR